MRFVAPGFILLLYARQGQSDIRFGITITKKVGNAVVRNRMKRRFRALIFDILPWLGCAGNDYILIGRKEGIERDFGLLHGDLEKGLSVLHHKQSKQRRDG